MTGRIGIIALGQTPRPDFEAAFRRHSGAAEVAIVGALDGLTADSISRLTGVDAAHPLLTRLADGTSVVLERDAIARLLPGSAETLARDGASVVVVACTSAFDPFECDVPLLLPGTLVPAVIRTLTREGRLGIVVSVPSQEPDARRKWEGGGFSVKVASASPFQEQDLEAAAMLMSDDSLEFVVLDCMGHSASHRAQLAELSRRPTLASQTLVARIAGEVASAIASQDDITHLDVKKAIT